MTKNITNVFSNLCSTFCKQLYFWKFCFGISRPLSTLLQTIKCHPTSPPKKWLRPLYMYISFVVVILSIAFICDVVASTAGASTAVLAFPSYFLQLFFPFVVVVVFVVVVITIFACCLSRPASVISPFISIKWCFRPYMPNIIHVWRYLVVSGACMVVSGVAASAVVASSAAVVVLFLFFFP